MKALEALRWVIIAPEVEVKKWTTAIHVKNPSINLEVGPKVANPEEVDILLLWNHPTGCLAPFTGVKLYYSLGAGVDHLMKDKGLIAQVPICRIVDPLLSFSMSNYILFAVLHYQRQWDKYTKDRENKIWDHDAVTERNIKIGILGLGTLGTDAAKKLQQMGFDVVGYSPSPKKIPNITTYAKGALSQFLTACNVLVCTVPFTPATQGLLSMPLFQQLKHPTYLINVARGGVQVETDILEALDQGILTGAFLDVFETEPLPKEHPFWEHPNIQITPHIASITNPEAGVGQILENAIAVQKGEALQHTVDFSKGY